MNQERKFFNGRHDFKCKITFRLMTLVLELKNGNVRRRHLEERIYVTAGRAEVVCWRRGVGQTEQFIVVLQH